MERVLHVISSTMRAGVVEMVMNVYREADRSRLQFDFVAHELGNRDFDAEIESLGGRVFRIPFLSETGMRRFTRLVENIIRQHGPYIAVHAHTDYQAGFSALAAKRTGVPVRICHAHADTRGIHSPAFLLKKYLGRAVIRLNATQRCACSPGAGMSTFGRHAVKKGRVRVIKNGISLSGYGSCPPQTMQNLREACHANEASRLVGCVGRLSPEKNPAFMLNIAAEAKKAGLNLRFIFAGDGILRNELAGRCRQLDLTNTVCFLGVRDDVPHLMQCFDLVLVPSFAEGFSLAALEAQAAGTPALVTPGVPHEADMGIGLFHALPLNTGASGWLSRIGELLAASARPEAAVRFDAIRARGYDVRHSAHSILSLYGLSPKPWGENK